MSSGIVLLCVPDDHDSASAQEGSQVSFNLLARAVLSHQVKRIIQKLKEEVT